MSHFTTPAVTLSLLYPECIGFQNKEFTKLLKKERRNMETSKLFIRLARMSGKKVEGYRGLSVVHSRILNRLEKYELNQFEKGMKKIRLDGIPVKQGNRTVSYL